MFLNRELSWLAFNERVLEEAADPGTPLLERLKFVAIAASNLDEFFMVRVAALEEAAAADDESRDLAGLTPAEQLRADPSTHARVRRPRSIALTRDELLPELADRNIRIVPAGSLGDRSLALGAFFRDNVLPVLTPLGDRRVPAVPAAGVAEPQPGTSVGAPPARPRPGWRSSRSRPDCRAWCRSPRRRSRLRAARGDHPDACAAAVPRPGGAGIGGHPPVARRGARSGRRRRPHASRARRARDPPPAQRRRDPAGGQSSASEELVCCSASASSSRPTTSTRCPARSICGCCGPDGDSRLRGSARSSARAGGVLAGAAHADLSR